MIKKLSALWNAKFHDRVRNFLPLGSVLGEVNLFMLWASDM
jgi:hypothetical protein